MNKTELMNKATRSINRLGLKFKKHSPAICIALGIGTGIAATISACKATTKLQGVLDYHEEEAKKFKKGMEEGRAVTVDNQGNQQIVEYTPEDAQRDMFINKVHTVLDVAKLYGPSIILGGVSIGLIVGGYRQEHKRYIGASTALVAVTNDFKGYRGRVVERFGEELDRELKYNLKPVEVEETVVKEDGTEEVVKKTVMASYGPMGSPYAIIWDDGNKGFLGHGKKYNERHKFHIMQVQAWANDRLREKGHLYLNEVLDALGVDRTDAGQDVGWIYNEEDPFGDNFVSFGIFERAMQGSQPDKNFINLDESAVLIDFNVAGNIRPYLYAKEVGRRRI